MRRGRFANLYASGCSASFHRYAAYPSRARTRFQNWKLTHPATTQISQCRYESRVLISDVVCRSSLRAPLNGPWQIIVPVEHGLRSHEFGERPFGNNYLARGGSGHPTRLIDWSANPLQTQEKKNSRWKKNTPTEVRFCKKSRQDPGGQEKRKCSGRVPLHDNLACVGKPLVFNFGTDRLGLKLGEIVRDRVV